MGLRRPWRDHAQQRRVDRGLAHRSHSAELAAAVDAWSEAELQPAAEEDLQDGRARCDRQTWRTGSTLQANGRARDATGDGVPHARSKNRGSRPCRLEERSVVRSTSNRAIGLNDLSGTE